MYKLPGNEELDKSSTAEEFSVVQKEGEVNRIRMKMKLLN